MSRLLVICNPDNRRTTLLAQAAHEAGWQLERFPYRSLLENFDRAWPHLQRRARRADVVRLDSPAEDFAVECQLLRWGWEAAVEQLPAGNRVAPAEIDSLTHDHGRILFPRQSYLGYAALLQRLQTSLPNVCWMNAPETVLAMFDKPTTIERLRRAQVPATESAGLIGSWTQVKEAARTRDWDKVFVKIANGSSASGVLAIDLSGSVTALTSVEVEEDLATGGVRLYNSLNTQCYEGEKSVARLVDALAGERLHLERWLPKAQVEGREFDLRVVVTAGEPTHWVMRVSRGSPMTNLHLGNERGDLAALRARLDLGADAGPTDWERMEQLCRDAAAVFPNAHYAGLDVMLSPQGLRILECNAYGDLLPGIVDELGLSTHQRQLRDWPH